MEHPTDAIIRSPLLNEELKLRVVVKWGPTRVLIRLQEKLRQRWVLQDLGIDFFGIIDGVWGWAFKFEGLGFRV